MPTAQVGEDSASDRPVLLAAIASGAMIAQQVAGRATRDALFLASFGAADVPKVMAAGAALSFGAVVLLSRALLQLSPARVVPATFAASSVLLALEWALARRAPGAAALVFYLHIAVFGATLISAFWSLVNERFDPHTARHSIGRIAGGGTVGGVIGGLFAWRASRLIDAPTMLLALSAVSALTAWATHHLGAGLARAAGATGGAGRTEVEAAGRTQVEAGRTQVEAGRTQVEAGRTEVEAGRTQVEAGRTEVEAGRTQVGAGGSGLAALRDNSHLRDLGLLVGLGAVSGALFDVALSAEAAAAMTDRNALLSFFALFHLSVSVLSFLVQSLAATFSLDRLGLAATIGILPAAVVASTLSLVVAPRLWAASIVRATEAVLRNSLFRSGYELLYTPLPPDQKRSIKTLIDVGFDRIGTAAGSGLAMALLVLAPGASLPLLLGLGAAAAGVTLLFTPRLHRGYVAALEGSLRSGAVSLDPTNVVDATTRRTLSGTVDALSRDRVLAELAALRNAAAARHDAGRASADGDRTSHPGPPLSGRSPLSGRASLSGPAPADSPRPPAGDRRGVDGPLSARAASAALASDPVLAATADLRSGDPERIRRALVREPDPALVPHLLPLLEREGLTSEVIRALRAVAPRATGQLTDALLDPSVSVALRRRIPRVLQACPTQRAADGLILGLADERFEVRFQCGVALARLLQQRAPIHLRRDDVIEAAMREIAIGRRVWDAQPPSVAAPVEAPLAERLLVERTSRSLEHVFRVLSLCLEREPLEIAYRALHADDAHLRGTALEYLENVLPAPIRESLWPYLGARAPAPPEPGAAEPRAPRLPEHALDELRRSAASIPRASISAARRRREPRT
ncbi:putative membrane protein [Sorangium cellulosum So ce56]|uniref:Membrane protein n=1 Tax=Sorangium cellulosum (strain So ce56) TaxID=448385 RepID=A9GXU7_SORC5|nr:hypothetical protein [Sorangium cellulosum]CAN97145.1 putative membrane protein [Sorangium cellulosum So ce56]